LGQNPFHEMAIDIDLPKAESECIDVDPFTREERDVIIQAFKQHQKYNHYASFVEFLTIIDLSIKLGTHLLLSA